MSARLFLLSPANCGGQRARMLFRDAAEFALARQLREPEGAPLGDVFSFMSGLYFRGKLAYARAFAAPPPGVPGVFVITPTDGLVDPEERVDRARLQGYGAVDVDVSEPRYTRPLLAHLRELVQRAPGDCRFVLLGSVATPKYAEPLQHVLGDRVCFPAEFVGRGDMSRGGLMLRCVDEGRELDYVPIAGAVRHGQRPAKLVPRPRGASLLVRR